MCEQFSFLFGSLLFECANSLASCSGVFFFWMCEQFSLLFRSLLFCMCEQFNLLFGSLLFECANSLDSCSRAFLFLNVCELWFFFLMVNSLSSCPGANPAFPQGKSLTSWLASHLEKACSLVLSFGLAVAPWRVIISMRLFTFSESSTFTSKVETCFMREGIELWTSFVLPRRLNTESLFCEGFFVRAVHLMTSRLSWFWRRLRVYVAHPSSTYGR